MITNPDFFLTESQKKLKAKLEQKEVRFPALLETVTKSNCSGQAAQDTFI